MYAAVDATLPGSLSSYSFRRVAPTWASLAKLSEDQKLALGNSVATTPARYSAAKLRLAVQLKLSLLGAIRFFGSSTRWQEVSQQEAKVIFEQDMVAADIALAASTSTVVHTHLPSPDDTSLALRDSWIQGARARLAPRRSAGKCLEQREDEPMSSAGQPSVAPAEMKSPPPRPAS